VATVAALPGVSGLVSKVSLLSPQPLASPDHVARLESNLERLQADVERLREQVEFLEELLGRRAEAAGLPVSAGD
jgi:peptidoglycan hydrolase CwlO-like protein